MPSVLLFPDIESRRVLGTICTTSRFLLRHCRTEAAATGLTTRTFVAARIVDWPASSPFPLVEVRQSLGPTGDIDAGTAAILAGEGVRDEDFGLEVCFGFGMAVQ